MSRQLWLGMLWLLGASVALAQVRMPAPETAFAPRPITLREGETIVNAAWERERQTDRRPDCSHLVHEVYTHAGYPYPYADSFELYAGMHSFVRVQKPQPGDLVVWRGHVGIVVDPGERSFYSSVTSGLRTEFYDAPVWRARGSARFYRYAAATRGNLTLANERRPRITKEPVQVITALPAEESRGNSSGTAEPITKSADSTTTVASDLGLPSTGSTLEIPSSILVAASRDKPTEGEIAEAVSELNNGTGSILREEDLSRLDRKVIVYDNLSVDRIEFKGNRGSAQARIKARVTLLGESIERKPHYEKFRWELRRVKGGWEVLIPKDRVYVPRDVAVRMLAARLASLAQDSGVSGSDSSLRQQAQIVHALSALFEEGL
jgi:NlpC/P60 family protein